MNTATKGEWPPVKAICFDVDGTLYNQPALRIRMALVMLRELLGGRLKLGDLKVLSLYRKNRERCRKLGAVEDLENRVLSLTAEELSIPPSQVFGFVQRWIYREPLSLLRSARSGALVKLLERLRTRGYKLAVFSDYPVKDKLEALGVHMDLFDALVESGAPEVNAFKPHPKGFLEVCRRLELSPASVVYVGDRWRVDGIGALGAGMRFVLLSPLNIVGKRWQVIRHLSRLERALAELK